MSERFQDQNLRISDFYTDVLVVCPNCAKKAMVKVDDEAKNIKLLQNMLSMYCPAVNVLATDTEAKNGLLLIKIRCGGMV